MTCCLTSISDIKHNVKKSKINSFNCHFPHRKNISDNVFQRYEKRLPNHKTSSRWCRSGQSKACIGCDCMFLEKKSVYKAVERHTSPSWYWGLVWASKWFSWPLKLSLWNSRMMTDRDFPLVSGRKRPTYSADNRQIAAKGTKQYSRSPLCEGKTKCYQSYVHQTLH